MVEFKGILVATPLHLVWAVAEPEGTGLMVCIPPVLIIPEIVKLPGREEKIKSLVASA